MNRVTKPTKAMFMRILNSEDPHNNKGELLYSRNKSEFDRRYFIWLKKYISDRSLKNTKL